METSRAQVHPANSDTAKTPYRGVLQRKCACGQHTGNGGECEACKKKRLQRKAANHSDPSTVPPIVHEVLQSPGQPLDSATRAFMEPRFGHSFTDVQLHTGARATESARAVNALAYTVGPHLVFQDGYYDHSVTGQRLLAHELAHVVQQRPPGRTIRQNVSLSPETSTGLEYEADRVAERVLSGEPVHISGQVGDALQRQAAGNTSTSPSRPDREERFNIGRGGNRFDAEVNRPQKMLTLKMKVRFNFLGTGGANTPESWPSPAAQQTWQNNFIRTVQSRWSFRHYLVPDSPCPAEPFNRAIARVQVIPVTSNPHFTMNVAYTTDFEGSAVSRNPTSAALGREATMDALDVQQRSDIPQVPAEHEFGHMLGLPHVHCDRNDPVCYGVTSQEKANIMGEGKVVSTQDYAVFAEAMNYFNGCNWHAESGSSSHTGLGALIGGLGGALVGAGIGSMFGPIGALVGGLIGAGVGLGVGAGIGSQV